ncbi:hypothetical protein [Nostoc sp.]|uniref:hypothetical protein n=1 Tax=Nostoc sp. TaxID=1180 RepID=UPI002FF4C9D2
MHNQEFIAAIASNNAQVYSSVIEVLSKYESILIQANLPKSLQVIRKEAFAVASRREVE